MILHFLKNPALLQTMLELIDHFDIPNEQYLRALLGQSFEKIEKDTDRDYFLSAEEAKNYGLIDRVITHPSEANQS